MFEFVQPNDEPTYQCTICHELPTGDNKAFGCSKQQHIVCAKCSARVRECPLKCGSTSFVSIDGILGRLIPIIKVRCKECKKELEYGNWERHVKQECVAIRTGCPVPGCKWVGHKSALAKHDLDSALAHNRLYAAHFVWLQTLARTVADLHQQQRPKSDAKKRKGDGKDAASEPKKIKKSVVTGFQLYLKDERKQDPSLTGKEARIEWDNSSQEDRQVWEDKASAQRSEERSELLRGLGFSNATPNIVRACENSHGWLGSLAGVADQCLRKAILEPTPTA